MRTFSFACVIVLLGVAQSQIFDKCNDKVFDKCLLTAAQSLGWQDMTSNYTVFTDRLVEILKQEGIDGAKKECKALADLQECVGKQYSTCVSRFHLIWHRISIQDSVSFVSLSEMMKFTCNVVWETIENNWGCLADATNKDQKHFRVCANKLEEDQKKNPFRLCKHMQEYSDCVASPYNSCGEDITSTVCRTLKAALESVIPCTIKCST